MNVGTNAPRKDKKLGQSQKLTRSAAARKDVQGKIELSKTAKTSRLDQQSDSARRLGIQSMNGKQAVQNGQVGRKRLIEKKVTRGCERVSCHWRQSSDSSGSLDHPRHSDKDDKRSQLKGRSGQEVVKLDQTAAAQQGRVEGEYAVEIYR